MSQAKVYVVIGASRGIGFALVAKLASDYPSAIVYGTSRDVNGSMALAELSKGHPNVRALTADVTDVPSIKAAVAVVAKESGHVDVLVHNSGIGGPIASIKELDLDEVVQVWEVNTKGPFTVYQAFRELFLKSDTRKFSVISSVAGSIGAFVPMPIAAYGSSKAALNYMLRVLAAETKDEGFIVTAIHPGFVLSDMGKKAAQFMSDNGFPEPDNALTPDESAARVVSLIERNYETDKFLSDTGDEIPW